MYRNFSAVIDQTFFVLQFAPAPIETPDDAVELAHVTNRDTAPSSDVHRPQTKMDHPADWWWGLPSL